MSSLNATFVVTCFCSEWSHGLNEVWILPGLNASSTWEMYCWYASHLRACCCCCTDTGQTCLLPCRIHCSAVQVQEVQNNYVMVEAELRLLFIRLFYKICKFDQGTLNFWERYSKRCPFRSLRRMIPSLVNGEKAKLVLKFDVLHSWWVLIEMRWVVVLNLTVEQRTWESHIGKVLQTFENTA